MLEPLDCKNREPQHYNNYKESKVNKFVEIYGLCLAVSALLYLRLKQGKTVKYSQALYTLKLKLTFPYLWNVGSK